MPQQFLHNKQFSFLTCVDHNTPPIKWTWRCWACVVTSIIFHRVSAPISQWAFNFLSHYSSTQYCTSSPWEMGLLYHCSVRNAMHSNIKRIDSTVGWLEHAWDLKWSATKWPFLSKPTSAPSIWSYILKQRISLPLWSWSMEGMLLIGDAAFHLVK